MFSKFKKVLVSMALTASLALAPMSGVSAMFNGASNDRTIQGLPVIQKRLPIEQYYKVEKVANELGILHTELQTLNYLDLITYDMVYYLRPINKSAILTKLQNMLERPNDRSHYMYKGFITSHKTILARIRDEIQAKIQNPELELEPLVDIDATISRVTSLVMNQIKKELQIQDPERDPESNPELDMFKSMVSSIILKKYQNPELDPQSIISSIIQDKIQNPRIESIIRSIFRY